MDMGPFAFLAKLIVLRDLHSETIASAVRQKRAPIGRVSRMVDLRVHGALRVV